MRKPFAIAGALLAATAAVPQAAEAAFVGFDDFDAGTPGLDAGRRA